MKRVLISLVLFSLGMFVYAQKAYKVFSVKGDISIWLDNNSWKEVKKGNTVYIASRIKLKDNSKLSIIDESNKIYTSNQTGEILIGELVNKRKSYLESITLKAVRTSLGGSSRGPFTKDHSDLVSFDFINPETERVVPKKKIKEGELTPCYLRINNLSKDALFCNVYISYSDGHIEPYLNSFFSIGENESVDFSELILGISDLKQMQVTLYVSKDYVDSSHFENIIQKNPELLEEMYPEIIIID